MTKKQTRPGGRRPSAKRASAAADSAVSDLEARAKLFWNGRSQAVRLPKAFRFAGDEVLIRRQGERVILEPVTRRRWPKGYWERLRELTERFEFPDVEPLGGRLLDVRLDET